MTSLYESAVARLTVPPALRANGTATGVAVDRAASGGSESMVLVVVTGAITDGSHAVTLEDSDTGAGGWAALAGALTGALPTVVGANDDTVFEVGVSGGRRFVRAVITTTGATTGGIVSAVVVLGELGVTPAVHS